MRTNELSLKMVRRPGIFSPLAKALVRPSPETDARKRRDMRATRDTAEAPPRRQGPFERLDHWFWTRKQRDVEAYLATAADVYDLEARIRTLERNVPHPYY